MKRAAILKKLILETLFECRGNLMKRDSLFATVNFSADPTVRESEFDLIVAELEKGKRVVCVPNEDTGALRIGITANGVAALSEM